MARSTLENKVCSVCGEEKPLDEYHKDNNPRRKNKYRADCRACNNKKRAKHKAKHPAQQRNWRTENKNKITGYNKKNRERILKTDPEYDKKHYLRYKERRVGKDWAYSIKAKYGLTVEQYENILAAQGYKCAICQRDTSQIYKSKSRLSVDHDHITGAVRGILCTGCNGRLLPSIGESAETAARLFFYLTKKHEYGFVPEKTSLKDDEKLSKRRRVKQ